MNNKPYTSSKQIEKKHKNKELGGKEIERERQSVTITKEKDFGITENI